MAANGSPALMRAINASRVIQELRAGGVQSRADLVRATGLSKPTITNVVAHLEALEYIARTEETAKTTDGRGAQAPRYEYRASRGQVLGIDIGADKTLLVLADLAGTTLGSARFTTPSTQGVKRILGQISRTADRLLADAGGTSNTLLAVVAGTPGVVSRDGVVTMAPQLDGWEGLDLAGALREIFSCPVAVESEVTLSLQAERWLGVTQGIDDALFVHLGVGVGAGLLVDGLSHRGADGAAGEIGLMPYPVAQPDGGTVFQPLESLASGGALQRRGAALAATPEGALLKSLAGGDADAVDAALVFTAMRQSDPAATALVDDAIAILAWGISCLVCALNPRRVVLGGGLSGSADMFLDTLRERVATSVPFAPEWFVSELGDEAVAFGAVNQATVLVESGLFESLNNKELVS
ncbi:ROK family protein [soil metagenome]